MNYAKDAERYQNNKIPHIKCSVHIPSSLLISVKASRTWRVRTQSLRTCTAYSTHMLIDLRDHDEMTLLSPDTKRGVFI